MKKVAVLSLCLTILQSIAVAQVRGRIPIPQGNAARARETSPNEAKSGPLAYAVAPTPDYSATQFGVLDVGLGKFTPVSTTPAVAYGIAKDAHSRLYELDINGDLNLINPGNGKTARIGPTGILPQFVSALSSTSDGALYTLDTRNYLYSVNGGTGAATLIGATGIPPYDPLASPYAVSLTGGCRYLYYVLAVYGNYPDFVRFPALWRIDTQTAAAELIAPIAPPLPFFGAAYLNGALFEFSFDETFRGGPGPKVYQVNVTTGNASLTSDLNVPSVYGAVPLGEGNARNCPAN